MGGSEEGSDAAKSQIAGLMASSHIPYILNRLNMSISSNTEEEGEGERAVEKGGGEVVGGVIGKVSGLRDYQLPTNEWTVKNLKTSKSTLLRCAFLLSLCIFL